MRINIRTLLLPLIFSALILCATSNTYAQEKTYDLNKVRMKIFHLLNFSPADNTLVPHPGSGTKTTPTPTPTSPGGGGSASYTRIYIAEPSGDNVVGGGSFNPSTNIYRLVINKTVPLKSKTATNKYVLWLTKTTVTPQLNEFVASFEASSLPSIDKPYTKNLSDYNELIVTEESSASPVTPNLGAIIIRGILQAPAAATPTPPPPTPTAIVPATPTPSGSGQSGEDVGGLFGSIENIFRGLFGL